MKYPYYDLREEQRMTPMEKTEQLTQAYRACHDLLSERVESLDDQLLKIKKRRLPGIKAAVQAVAQARAELAAHMQANRQLFDRPRTRVIFGTKVGYRKGTGKVQYADEARVVRLIQKVLPEQVEVLIKTTSKPVKAALKNLDVSQLTRIGCTAEDAGDVLVIQVVDSDVEKLVSALLDEADKWEEAA